MPTEHDMFNRDFGIPIHVSDKLKPGQVLIVNKKLFGDLEMEGRRVAEKMAEQKQETGDSKRKDAGKAKGFWLIPPDALTQLAEVYAIGAAKYEPRGWEKGMEWSRIVDPMFRHMLKYMKGETHDATDGQHHLASVAWACLALMEYERTHPEMDDLRRPGTVDEGWPQFMGQDHVGP